MKKTLTSLLLLLYFFPAFSQTNFLSTNPVAEEIMLGNYTPADYLPATVLNHPGDIVAGILNNVSSDSLKSYLVKLRSFETRNTGSDTLSPVRGIGAARRWVYQKFQGISAENESRLVPSYLQFDQNICNVGQHRNVFAVLPGLDETAEGIVLIEAHIDSRCNSVCDTTCLAEGMEDNGSGAALVIELARAMSQLAFNHTIVFMATIGEEQGLYGADAFASYAVGKGVAIKAVLNNDIVGGIICGETSSQPSCPGLNNVDSTQVRLFSAGSFNSANKQLSRFIKLEYEEELKNLVAVPMLLTIMSGEDRSGRGGDHIPFRQKGFVAMRFTSANEHGNANTGDPGYHDRQHTSGDVLGVDTDGDLVIDSFFVDFNYLARNVVINGVAAGMAAIGPKTPDFDAGKFEDSIYVSIADPNAYGEYRVFVRTTNNDFDEIYTTNSLNSTVPKPDGVVIVSVASVDANGIESLFSKEVLPTNFTAAEEVQVEQQHADFELFQNRPNPFDEATFISFIARNVEKYREAHVVVSDSEGRVVKCLPVKIKGGMNEMLYHHGYNVTGVYTYSLVVDGQVVDTKRMVFAN